MTAWRGIRRLMTDKVKILVVEDDSSVAMMMVDLLTSAGCDTHIASDAEKAVRLVQGGNFNLITLDVDLPRKNGFEICRHLKADSRLSDTPVVFVTGRSCAQDLQRGLELGAVDYITKPFDALDFVRRLLSHVNCQKKFA